MRLEDFQYTLPMDRIAQFPLKRREISRLMILKRKEREIGEDYFYNLENYLMAGDLLVLNDTKVFPARLIGWKEKGGKTEILLLRSLNGGNEWRCLIKGAKKVGPGSRIVFSEELDGIVRYKDEDGAWVIDFSPRVPLMEVIESIGKTPLPPYIKRDEEKKSLLDRERYQTVYACQKGSIAAPTAGLHFTKELLNSLKQKGIIIEYLTLHVGWGTFKPVRDENVEKHRLPPEEYRIPWRLVEEVKRAKKEKRRIVAVGTTTTRALETAFEDWDKPRCSGETSLFIVPGYPFRVIDALITNFHLPGTTLIMLVSAFGGREFVLRAYREAIERGYRFYSYGDAMLIM